MPGSLEPGNVFGKTFTSWGDDEKRARQTGRKDGALGNFQYEESPLDIENDISRLNICE